MIKFICGLYAAVLPVMWQDQIESKQKKTKKTGGFDRYSLLDKSNLSGKVSKKSTCQKCSGISFCT